MTNIASKVTRIVVAKLGVDEEQVTPEASLSDDLGADSLDIVEVIMEFGKKFNIEIPDDEAEKIKTIGNAVKYIEKKTNHILSHSLTDSFVNNKNNLIPEKLLNFDINKKNLNKSVA